MNEDRRIGQRAGIRWAIAWLHKQANEMHDPKAKAIINTAAYQMSVDAKALRAEDADDIAAGLEALGEPVVATWPEVKERMKL
jgi:1,2-phenylacetyl-CoA epoxidase catalytic subunit